MNGADGTRGSHPIASEGSGGPGSGLGFGEITEEDRAVLEAMESSFARRASSVVPCALCGTYGGSDDLGPTNALYAERLKELKECEERRQAAQLAYEAECRTHEATRLELELEKKAHELACGTIWFQSKKIGELQEQIGLSGKMEVRMIAEAAISFRRTWHCLRRLLAEEA